MRRLNSRLGLAAIVVASTAGCTISFGAPPASDPYTPPTTTTIANPIPVAPTIQSFTVAGGPFTSPALVALQWNVSDANGDDLTCRLDANGDGTYEQTVNHCQGIQSRTATATQGSYIAKFQVKDADHLAVVSTSAYLVGAGRTEPYNITLRTLGTMTPQVSAAFTQAKAFWESVIKNGVVDSDPFTIPPGQCGDDEPGITTGVDDVLITIEVAPIDGVGQILGQSGPCFIDDADNLTRAGVMRFDVADVDNMLANGSFTSVVKHEMAHVLGYGTLWNQSRSLLANSGTSNPRFGGPRAMAEWSLLGGSGGVPVENQGGPGTADGHWRESTFGNELMTGYLNTGVNPLSALSIASLGDLGYNVDTSVASPYSLPIGSNISALRDSDTGEFETPPIKTI